MMAVPSCFFCKRYRKATDRWGDCKVKKTRVNVFDKCVCFRWAKGALANDDTEKTS
jgi:hypothetical protein